MERIDPQPPSGFRDLLPSEARVKQDIAQRIATAFERSGFSPIDTPALEREAVLTGGDPAFAKQLYHARITESDEPLGLRFDLTVPLARYVSAHADDLVFPFSAYHIGSVWRGEHAQAGRYRQFVQCDADILGATTLTADAQVIALAHAVFKDLGIAERIVFRISNRKVLNGLAEFLGFDASRTPAVLRAIDKLDKQAWTGVAAELRDKVGLDDQQVDAIQELLDLKADTPEALLDQAHAMLQFNAPSHPGIEELRELIRHLDAMKVPRSAWKLDLAIARGLGYYTGTVFETMLAGVERYGSVCSGGRYDNLVERFSPLHMPGVGMSIGLDRLMAALDELGLLPPIQPPAKIAVLDFEPAAHGTALELVSELRDAGVSSVLSTGTDDSLKGQLAWAVKSGFPYVAIIGAQEHEKGVVQLKDMAARTQEEVPIAELAGRLS